MLKDEITLKIVGKFTLSFCLKRFANIIPCPRAHRIPLKCSVKFCCTINYNTKKLKKKELGKKDQNSIFIKGIFTKINIYNSKALLSFIYEASFHHIIMSIKNCIYMHVLSILSFSWVENLHTVYKLTERIQNVSGEDNFRGR